MLQLFRYTRLMEPSRFFLQVPPIGYKRIAHSEALETQDPEL